MTATVNAPPDRIEQLKAEAVEVRNRLAAAEREVAAVRINLNHANARLTTTVAATNARLAEITAELSHLIVLTAFAECARCGQLGRVEWMPDEFTRVIHEHSTGFTTCLIQAGPNAPGTALTRALSLLR